MYTRSKQNHQCIHCNTNNRMNKQNQKALILMHYSSFCYYTQQKYGFFLSILLFILLTERQKTFYYSIINVNNTTLVGNKYKFKSLNKLIKFIAIIDGKKAELIHPLVDNGCPTNSLLFFSNLCTFSI